MKILFAIVDGGGNIPPQLAVARALAARGVEVQVLGHRGIRERVEAAGLAFEPFTDGQTFRSHRSAVAGGHHGGLHPRGGGSTSWRVRGGGSAAPRCGRRRRRHDPHRGNSRDRRLRHPDDRFRALLLSRGSGPRCEPGRMDASTARHGSPCARTPRAAANRLRSRRSRPDARKSCGMPYRRRVAGGAEGRRAGICAANPGQPQHVCLRRAAPNAPEHPRRDRAATRRGDRDGRAGHRRRRLAGAAERGDARLARP